MKLLITQIGSGHTHYLMQALVTVSQSEVQQLLSAICLTCMDDVDDL